MNPIALHEDTLMGALIGLARATDGHPPTPDTHRAMVGGLRPLPHEGREEEIARRLRQVLAEKDALLPGCRVCASPCGRRENYDMKGLWQCAGGARALKSAILTGLLGMADLAWEAIERGLATDALLDVFYQGLFVVGEDWDEELLLPTVQQVGEGYLRFLALHQRG